MPHHKSARLAVAAVLGAAALGLSALAASRLSAPASQPANAQITRPPTTAPTNRAASTGALPLKVTGATVVAVPPGIRETSVFATLTNTGRVPIVLSGVGASVAEHGMLMVTTTAGNMTGMSMTHTLTIPAGGQLVLSDTGDHLMLMGLKRSLRVGETLSLTLSAADGRSFTLRATVRMPGA